MEMPVYVILDDSNDVIKLITNRKDAEYYLKLNPGTSAQTSFITLTQESIKSIKYELIRNKKKNLSQAEKELYVKTYIECGKNLKKTAEKLGIPYANLFYHVSKNRVLGDEITRKSKKTVKAKKKSNND